MVNRSASKNPRKRVKRLLELKGAGLFEITRKKKRIIPKHELAADEP
jgi:hypothetical protein